MKLDDTIGCTNIKPCAQGEGLKPDEAAGAELIGLSDIELNPCGTPGTGLMEDIRTSGRNRIFVNKSGERFVNEGAERDTLCKAIFAQPESTYWIVVNKVRYPSKPSPTQNGATIENMLALGHIVKGETVEDLAKQTQMDAAKLQASIDGYNKTVAGEAEDPFGFQSEQHRRPAVDRRALVRLPEGADGASHDGRHPHRHQHPCARCARMRPSRAVRLWRMHRRHPRQQPAWR